jgi:hypothetical protein
MQRFFLPLALLFLVSHTVLSPVHATLINAGDTVRFDFDFSGQTLEPPYLNLTPKFFFDAGANDFGPDEFFIMHAFNASGLAVSGLRPVGPFVTASGGAVEATFGGLLGYMTSPLDTLTGHLIMSSVVGSFGLKRATIWGGVSNGQTSSVQMTASRANAPGIMPLLAIGVLAFASRLRKKRFDAVLNV